MNGKTMIDTNVAEQQMAAGDFRGPGLFEVTHADGSRLATNVRRLAGADREPGSVFIGAGTVMLGLLGAGLLYVSFSALSSPTSSPPSTSMRRASSRP